MSRDTVSCQLDILFNTLYMMNYIDGFVFPIASQHLADYKLVAEKVAKIWIEHGALSYNEYVGDDLELEGTRSFKEMIDLAEGEVVVFGCVVFPSKNARDKANQAVPNDPRMYDLVAPLIDRNRLIFDSRRMVYGGFKPLVM